MDNNTPACMNSRCLDLLYNHKAICEALVKSGESAASEILYRRASALRQLSACGNICELRCIFLNSLNRSLYNFILFTWDISLAQCCFENKAVSHLFDDEPRFLLAGEKILESYAKLICANRPRSAHVEQACRYIDAHLNEPLTLSAVSQSVYISRAYLSQMFKEQVGLSFTEYVNARRLVKARRLLLTTDLKIDEIAEACGFFSSTYFSIVFKKSTQLTPRTFRRRHCGVQTDTLPA